jgi:endonuclease/exonuclease/phosphatase family metal-dependent hydrolase
VLSVKPAGHELWCHCVHLSHGLDRGGLREAQLLGLQKVVDGLGGDTLHLLGGDMNARPDSDEMRYLRGLTSLEGRRCYYQDAWLRHHGEGAEAVTWSMQSGEARKRRSIDVDMRLDYLYVGARSRDGRGSVLASGRALVPAEGDISICSDHCAVWAKVQV